MKLLFFSPDGSEVEEVGKEFTHAGIPCEVRSGAVAEVPQDSACAELWIQNDGDCHRAFMLCVQLGVGFASRGGKNFGFDS
jgi:hypothetical protein